MDDIQRYLPVLTTWLRTLAPIPEKELAAFSRVFRLRRFAPGEFFTRAGDGHDRVGFVLMGVFRVYYTGANGEIHIRNFCKEGSPIGSYATILTGRPAHVSIEALEDALAIEFPYGELERRYAHGAHWERLGRRVAEEHYIARERREHHLLAYDANGRYERFLEDFPGLEKRVTQANVASYIGVKPETLSRLLKNRAET